MHHVHVWCPQQPEKGVGSSRPEAIDGYELLCGNQTQGILKEQPVFFNHSLSHHFSPRNKFLNDIFYCIKICVCGIILYHYIVFICICGAVCMSSSGPPLC